MSQPFIGQIVLFAGNFAPRGWALCNGQLLPISQNTALFSILGTTYGGNGQTTFALPDLRGRVAVSSGQGPGLTPRSLGEMAGSETVTLTASQMPAHSHAVNATNNGQTTNRPQGAIPAKGGTYATGSPDTTMNPGSIVGGGQPHDNLPPYTTLNYIIALQGIFPSRN